jgi:hypothetical protein
MGRMEPAEPIRVFRKPFQPLGDFAGLVDDWLRLAFMASSSHKSGRRR